MARVDTIMHLSLQIASQSGHCVRSIPAILVGETEKYARTEKPSTGKELGRIDLLKAGDQLGTPELLFEKIEDETIAAQVQKL